MGTRRLFMQAAAATAALPIFAPLFRGRAAAQPAPAPMVLDTVLFDPHFPESRAFAEMMGASGRPARAVGADGDVSRLWTDHLQPRWDKAPAPIAGLTGQGALFCLEQLAWAYGMRVVFQADHSREPGGGVDHAVFASAEEAALEARLSRAGADYGAEAARILASLPAAQRQVIWRSGATVDPDRPEPLVSWVIAPVSSAAVLRSA